MAKYKVTQWVTASVPIVSIVEANSEEEAEENLSNNIGAGEYKYRYDKIHYGELESMEAEKVEEGIDPETGIDSATGKQRIGIKGGYDFDEYTVDADSDGVLVTFGNDEIEIERSDWNEGELTIKVNGESVTENLEEVSEDEEIQRLKSLVNFRK